MTAFAYASRATVNFPWMDFARISRPLRRMRWRHVVDQFTVRRIFAGLVALFLILFSFGWMTRNDPGEKPYLEILGGSFIYNYRVGDEFYGLTAIVQKPLAEGSIVEVQFENPAGGAPLIDSQRVSARTNRYSFQSPTIHGVVAGKPYHVVIRIYDREKKKLLWTTKQIFRSQISDDVVPKRPLTIGPGYTPNPDR